MYVLDPSHLFRLRNGKVIKTTIYSGTKKICPKGYNRHCRAKISPVESTI